MPNPLVTYLASGSHRRGEPLRVGEVEVAAVDVIHALAQLREGRPELHAVLCAYSRPKASRRTMRAIGAEFGLSKFGVWHRLARATALVLACV